MNTVPRARRLKNQFMMGMLGVAVLAAAVPLVAILFEVVAKGIGAIHGLSFFTQPPPGNALSTQGGLANAIVGTLLMVVVASVIVIPLGIIGGAYLVEFGRGTRLARAVRFFAEVMTGIPSIMFGVFAYGLVVVTTHHFSALAGSLALGLIMWPIVLRTSEEMLTQVPPGLREASMALGIPKWKTVFKVVLPNAAAGLTTGSMLAVARASGETAPLLFTSFANSFISFKINEPISALPIEIYNGAKSAFIAQSDRAWAGALTLITLILVLTLVARFVSARRSV